jgi:hypothetical protein
MHGPDAEVASRQLALLIATGTIGGNLVLVRERAAGVPRLDPPLECLPPEPEAPEPPEPICEDQPEDDPPPARTSIRVSLFFDGTANNRANTRARLRNTQAFRDNRDEGSFQNDYTNVSRLETLCLGDDTFAHAYSIYVEGIGTTNNMRSPAFQQLRHDYLHFSAYYGATMGANDPQFTNDDAIAGQRRRIVQAG